ncbi:MULTISPECIES: hypothetical protein [Streptomyces]|uniref:hypothetical protein n=1 Tax=Streptomyces TaxID=1883 RepID=UPI00267D7745|nr:hypothetical protein [Streptomyces sp. HG99]
MREKSDAEEEPKKKRLDLNVPQVAGSAVAAAVAKLASYFGVYGTILGAGVVSAIATFGGTVFQNFFKRTGEQIRDVTVQAKPKPERAPAVGEFTEGTVYRARVKSWRRPLVAAALVFGITMTHRVRTRVGAELQRRREEHDRRQRVPGQRLQLPGFGARYDALDWLLLRLGFRVALGFRLRLPLRFIRGAGLR